LLNFKNCEKYKNIKLNKMQNLKSKKNLYPKKINKHSGGANMSSPEDNETRIKQIVEVLDQLSEDTSVPRNIRRGAKESKELLLNTKEALDVRTASASLILDELANDPNIPLHGRTLIWNIINMLAQFEAPKD
jgi:uncharacterized protein (UPF0147 family)